MSRIPRAIAVLSLLILTPRAVPQDRISVRPPRPVEIGQTEQVRVDLVLVEAMVVDRQGRTVPGLDRQDFTLVVSGREMPIDEFGATCAGESGDGGKEMKRDRADVPVPDMTRRTVLLFDYYHLSILDRGLVLEAAKRTVREYAEDGEEIMVAALADGLRIEEGFTADSDALESTLDRMEHDVTLWAGSFEPLSERSFFHGLSSLMDVLASHRGAKAVLLYSNFLGPSRSYDQWYWDVAQRAAMARTVVYPVFAKGLEDPLSATAPLGGSAGLTRLANESGGRFLRNTNDLTRAFSAAKDDIACRYTLGFYVDPEWARKPRTIRIRVSRRGVSVRAPEVFKAWTEEERRESALRAAFVQPDRFQDPLVRAHVFPLRPISKGMWSALTVVQFPLSAENDGATRTVDVVLERNGEVQGTLRREIRFGSEGEGATRRRTSQVDAATPGAPQVDPARTRLVTLYGEARVLDGKHELTIAVMQRDVRDPITTQQTFEIPEVPRGRLFVRGPVLALDTGAGLLLQDTERLRKRSRISDDSVLGLLLGPMAGLEPLLVHRVRARDRLAVLWETCGVDLADPPDRVTVERRFVDPGGAVIHQLEPAQLPLDGRTVRCAGQVDQIQPGTLPPGHYRLEISVTGSEGGLPGETVSAPIRITP